MLDKQRCRELLKKFDLKKLFIEELGWDNYKASLEVPVEGKNYSLKGVAEKRGMVFFVYTQPTGDDFPDYAIRRKIERQVAKHHREHLIVYTDDKSVQTWQWVKTEPGKPSACREHTYHCSQPGDALIQKIEALAVSFDEEASLTLVDVTSRVRAAFDVDKVTKRFYDRFKAEHATFLKFLKGIPEEDMQRWYVSVMINRLMFIYFIQRKNGFLNNDRDYLKTKLAESKERGKDKYYTDFLCPLFFEGFAKKESDRSEKISKLLGRVPYLNGGIFLPHQIEEQHGKTIEIPDKAFDKLFDFFDAYAWHLDERPPRKDNEINPDVLGYIFEKYINQKQMGAYYTKEDITEYIGKNTVLPFIFDQAKQKCKIAFEPNGSVWRLLKEDPDRYIYDAVKKGVELPLPPEIEKGVDASKPNLIERRKGWNKTAPEEYALPTEIWREVVARRKRYEEVHAKLGNGEIHDINDLITYNLDIRQFAEDVIANSEGPELLRAMYHAIENVTILDPTCGSGAFLFAALNILEPLYEACLDRMQSFLVEMDRSDEKHHPQKFKDFKDVLDKVEKHPNLKYFIYKSIIINNLYGVDIMDEAIEICKLRLFLKLVAQIESVEQIEPLPDIDFNIRAGNTLVGYATYDDVKKAVTSKLDFEGAMEKIEDKASDIDRLFDHFRKQQTEIGGEIIPEHKQELRKRLKSLDDELNRYLAGEYKVKPSDKNAYEKWLNSHKPFHWFIEFHSIMKNGGFDVIIGNPPYVEYKDICNTYEIRNFTTSDCSNLFAFVLERCTRLSYFGTEVGMIVPLSAFSTDRMIPLITHLKDHSEFLKIANFSWRPGKLFDGVNIQLSILLQKVSNRLEKIETTRYLMWDSEARPELFSKIEFSTVTDYRLDGSIPKLGSQEASSILVKLRKHTKEIGGCFTRHSDNRVFYRRGGLYWKVFVDFETDSSEEKIIHLIPQINKYGILATLSSGLWWWYFTITSDCRHLGNRDIGTFPFDHRGMKEDCIESLIKLGKKYAEDLKCNAQNAVRVYKRKKAVECLSFRVNQSKPIIDEIDRVLASHYGFTEDELDFMINYDIKYRMGKEGAEEAD